jgi:hypothetical protein
MIARERFGAALAVADDERFGQGEAGGQVAAATAVGTLADRQTAGTTSAPAWEA